MKLSISPGRLNNNFYILSLAIFFVFTLSGTVFSNPGPGFGPGPGHGPGPGGRHPGPGFGPGPGPGSHPGPRPMPGPHPGPGMGVGFIPLPIPGFGSIPVPIPVPGHGPGVIPVPIPVPGHGVVPVPVPVPGGMSGPRHGGPFIPIPHGRIYPSLPVDYVTLMVANSLFYYHGGNYYTHTNSGYEVVNPPIGAIIPSLPQQCTLFVLNGIVYYQHGNAYYREVSSGFEVIRNPATGNTYNPSQVRGKVVVIAQSLNVRSGPGSHNSILATTYSGNILKIIGQAPGWYYVELPDKTVGWVMKKYTIVVTQPANG